jgi:Zn-dependent protease with chaperone function
MVKEHVKALPGREAWRRESAAPSAYKAHNVLDAALHLSEGLHGVATARLAAYLGITDVEVHTRMRAYGCTPEPNAFAMGNGEKARGYRRSVLEAAKNG